MTMLGNHGSSNRELIALPGCEEEETAESERNEYSHFIILVIFFGLGASFCRVRFWDFFFLILITSITFIKVLREKLDRPHCLQGCYQMKSQTAAPGRQQGTGIFVRTSFLTQLWHSTSCYQFLTKRGFKSSLKEGFTFLEA